jgi:Domain of unknown function (DUF397)
MNHQLPPAPIHDELAQADWRKATKSQSANGCVEVAQLTSWTGVRDSKNPVGPVLLFTPQEWACFVDGAARGEFNRP